VRSIAPISAVSGPTRDFVHRPTERLQRPSPISRSESNDNDGVIFDSTVSDNKAVDFVQLLNDSDRWRFHPMVRYRYGVVHGL